jgi:hypothetical protein
MSSRASAIAMLRYCGETLTADFTLEPLLGWVRRDSAEDSMERFFRTLSRMTSPYFNRGADANFPEKISLGGVRVSGAKQMKYEIPQNRSVFG